MELQRIVCEAARLSPLSEEERRSWGQRFGEFAELTHPGQARPFTPDPRPPLPELSRSDYAAAFRMEAREWLEDFFSSEADREAPETRVAFGRISDGRSRRHDLAED